MRSAGGAPWRQFLTPTWLLGHALMVTVVISFSNFGAWQLRRHQERMARNAQIEQRLAAPAVSLETALREAESARASVAGAADAVTAPASAGIDPLEYTRVRVSGSFEPAHEVLKRPVSRSGAPGYHVVTPLVLDDGSAVLVERGWVPQSHGSVPVVEAPPPAGRVTLQALAFPSQSPPSGILASLAPRDPPEGSLEQVAYVDVVRLGQQVPYPLQPLRLVAEAAPDQRLTSAPGYGAALPLPPEPPEVSMGPHLGYAIQWYAFVAITVIGYAALLRRRAREATATPGLNP